MQSSYSKKEKFLLTQIFWRATPNHLCYIPPMRCHFQFLAILSALLFSAPVLAEIDIKALQYKTENLITVHEWYEARESLRTLIRFTPKEARSAYHLKELELTLFRLNYTFEGMNLIDQYTELYWNEASTLHQLLQILFSRKFITTHLSPAQKFAAGKAISWRLLNLVHAKGEQFAKDRAFTYTPGLAQFYYELKNKQKAIAVVEQGLQSLESVDPTLKAIVLPNLLAMLADYQDHKVCREGFCAYPPERWKAPSDCETRLFSRP